MDKEAAELLASQNSALTLELLRLSEHIQDQLRHVKTAVCYLEEYHKLTDSNEIAKASMSLFLAEEALKRLGSNRAVSTKN